MLRAPRNEAKYVTSRNSCRVACEASNLGSANSIHALLCSYEQFEAAGAGSKQGGGGGGGGGGAARPGSSAGRAVGSAARRTGGK